MHAVHSSVEEPNSRPRPRRGSKLILIITRPPEFSKNNGDSPRPEAGLHRPDLHCGQRGNYDGDDSFEIADRGGRDNGAFRTMAISGVELINCTFSAGWTATSPRRAAS